jgi:hypothetical protein
MESVTIPSRRINHAEIYLSAIWMGATRSSLLFDAKSISNARWASDGKIYNFSYRVTRYGRGPSRKQGKA